MKKMIAVALTMTLFAPALAHAVDGDKAQYVGGTVTAIKEKAEGRITTNDETTFKFDAKKDGTLDVPYTSITVGLIRFSGRFR